MTDEEMLYDNQHIALLEDIWGVGFLSPGGPEEVARVLEGLDLEGKRVLDIGCGSGAIAVLLARDYGAHSVIGIDVEYDVCKAAARLVEKEGVADRVSIRKVSPGPLDFPDQSFDLVFSKDSIIHIPDKETLAKDVFRILVPGGWFAASDWLIAHDDEPSAEMKAYIAAEALEFAMSSPRRYQQALEQAGFEHAEMRNRNPWYCSLAQEELARLTGSERARFENTHGADFIAETIETWSKMVRVLETGEHCPHHLRGQRPL